MSADTVLPHHTVLMIDGVIQEVVPDSIADLPAGARVLDARGAFLLPGLIDAHVHVNDETELASYLRFGVTTVVNLRGGPADLALRSRLRTAEIEGPRLFTSGPLLDGEPPIFSGSGTRVVTTESHARDAVAEHVQLGYDLIKVYNNLDPGLLEVIVREADAMGLPVVGHLPRRPVRREGLTRGLAAGIDLIAHGEEFFFTHFGGAPDSLLRAGAGAALPDDSAIADVAGRIRRAGTAVTPNLSFIAMTARMLDSLEGVLGDPEFQRLAPDVQEMWRNQNPTRRRDLDSFTARERVKYETVRRLTRALADSGVPLLVGTDASAPGMYPGASVHLELEELVAAGLTPYEAIAAGTVVPGRFLDEQVASAPRLGVVAPGYAADLLLVEGNPLEDVGVLRRPTAVFRGGMVVNRAR